MKKRLIVITCLACLTVCSCAPTMTTQQKVDSGFAVASQVYGLASVYYETNKDQISTEDRAKFAQYLAGFRMALETGQDLSGFAMRWYQFVTGA